ncbi:MAG: M48 family metalloprotease [archaeon]|nr:M48 family metalloprotease [archaeon]MCP8317030.1 M48 family metalloprotease [archaeon]MCP8319410.1 M48 family metalloprotease [archaeon]
MNLLKLRLSMIGTLAFLIALSTLFFTIILSLVGTLNIILLVSLVLAFNLIQWLIAPYIIDAMYRVKAISRNDDPKLYGIVERLSRKANIKMPKVMIAKIPIPNAFAYGSPIAGRRVAVTEKLLKTLEDEEVEAVIGHELGHLKHRDVQIMMFASVLPAIFYFIAYSFMLSAWTSGYRGERNGSLAILIGLASMVIYWILSLFVLGLSRLREYYADRHSVAIVDDGSRKLSEALAKIVDYSANMKYHSRQQASAFNSFRSLFISDPERADRDYQEMAGVSGHATDRQLVDRIISRRVTSADKILELFSTHPNIVKRLRALQRSSF